MSKEQVTRNNYQLTVAGTEQNNFSLRLQSPASQLMTSAVVDTYNNDNKLIRGRALHDTCSSDNLVTGKFANKPGIAKRKCSIPVGAVNDSSTVTKHVIKLKIRSMHKSFEKPLTLPILGN